MRCSLPSKYATVLLLRQWTNVDLQFQISIPFSPIDESTDPLILFRRYIKYLYCVAYGGRCGNKYGVSSTGAGVMTFFFGRLDAFSLFFKNTLSTPGMSFPFKLNSDSLFKTKDSLRRMLFEMGLDETYKCAK
jgi:hypothetical protein